MGKNKRKDTDESELDEERSSEAALVDELLGMPCWVVDVLPRRVGEEAGGQFFQVEPRLLAGRRLRRAFCDVILKLNCYYDFQVFRGGADKSKPNPKPEKLERWILGNNKDLSILIPAEETLVFVPTDSTYFALHNPSHEMLKLVRQLAGASGLFVWKAE